MLLHPRWSTSPPGSTRPSVPKASRPRASSTAYACSRSGMDKASISVCPRRSRCRRTTTTTPGPVRTLRDAITLFYLLLALAALFVPAKAQAGGGAYVFSGGSEAARAQVRAALEASSFDWGLVPATVTVRIANCGCAGSSPGLIVLAETLLAAAPYGRAYTWAIVQHEYAHQVWDFALDDGARALLRARLGGAD